MPLHVLKGDLVSMNVDAIVNAANVNLKMVEGVGRAIFHNAGDLEMTQACKALKRCEPGNAVVTPSFNITNTKMIIHAVAPIYINGKHREPTLLKQVYNKTLKIAIDHNLKSIAFPLLGGEFNWPLSECYDRAITHITDFLEKSPQDLDVYLVMYKKFPLTISDELHNELTLFITSNFSVEETKIEDSDINFIEYINKLYNDRNSTLKEVAFKSNISTLTLNKVLTNETYKPSKNLLYALSIGLGLDEEETNNLLKSSSYSINKANLFDLIILFFIRKKRYNIFEVNDALFTYDFASLSE